MVASLESILSRTNITHIMGSKELEINKQIIQEAKSHITNSSNSIENPYIGPL